jgi:hypothetical protein
MWSSGSRTAGSRYAFGSLTAPKPFFDRSGDIAATRIGALPAQQGTSSDIMYVGYPALHE